MRFTHGIVVCLSAKLIPTYIIVTEWINIVWKLLAPMLLTKTLFNLRVIIYKLHLEVIVYLSRVRKILAIELLENYLTRYLSWTSTAAIHCRYSITSTTVLSSMLSHWLIQLLVAANNSISFCLWHYAISCCWVNVDIAAPHTSWMG